jgi:hypothetical protein
MRKGWCVRNRRAAEEWETEITSQFMSSEGPKGPDVNDAVQSALMYFGMLIQQTNTESLLSVTTIYSLLSLFGDYLLLLSLLLVTAVRYVPVICFW